MPHARVAALAAVLLSLPVRAEPDGGTLLPAVWVPLPPDEDAPASPRRRDPSGAVSTVEVGSHAGEAKDAAELLATAPGVVIQDLGGLGQMKTLSVRGASPNGVLFFLDGVPLNGAGGQVDLASLPAAVIDHFELLRGSAGAKYGSGGLGGAVNVVTRQAETDVRVEGQAQYGSFGTESMQASGTGPVAGGAALAVAHLAHSTGDFSYSFNPTPQLSPAREVTQVRQNNDATAGGGLLKWSRALGSGGTVDALVEASGLDRGLAGTVSNPTPLAREADTRWAATARAEEALSAGHVAARAWMRQDGIRLQGDGFGGSLHQTQTVVGAEAEGAYAWGRHGVIATLQAGHEALDTYGGVEPARAVLSAMLSDEVLFRRGELSVVPSLRVDRAGPFLGFSPKVGSTAQLPGGFSLHANAGQAFRAPSFLELYVAQGSLAPNPDLKPERALFLDGQVQHATRWTRASVGAFGALYEDLISYEYYPPFFAKPFNFSTALVRGLEAEAEFKPARGLALSGAYTLTFSENLRDDPRYYLKELPYRPRHRLYARSTGEWGRWQARCEVLYQSQQFTNRTERVALPARAFVNAGITGEIWRAPHVSAALELKNAFDTQAQDFDGYPLPGRAIYVTLSVGWDPATASPTLLSTRMRSP